MMVARFNAAVALYQKAALNGYREVANSLVTMQKLAEERVEHELGVAALADAADLARSRYDCGPRELHRDSDRRSGSVSAAAACWRKRAAPSCARAQNCTGHLEEVGSNSHTL